MANNQIYMKLLQHAYQCRETSCSLMPSCQQMKQIISHTELCEQKTTCPVCRQLRVQCRYHSNHCQDTKCSVSICASLKYKIKLEKLEERLRQAHLLRRRMADVVPADLPEPQDLAEMQHSITAISLLTRASFVLVIFILLAMLKISVF